jgi:hypothetical protein
MDFTEKGVVSFTMPTFLDEIVREAKVANTADTSAGNNLFYNEETSLKLSEEAREALHSDIPKLLYQPEWTSYCQ